MRTTQDVMDIDMHQTAFNFAQPAWLWGLLLIPAGYAWYKYCNKKNTADLSGLAKFADAKLLPHILLGTHNASKRRNFGILYSLLLTCIILALANPRWGYTDLDAYQANASMVILLDLSASMNATDVAPSRIIRARQSIEDLLNASRGLKFGLIGFAGNPHLISPITDDIQTIKTYIPALDTDLTNVQGDSLHLALRMARGLLASEPGEQKSILLISDGNYRATDFAAQLTDLAADHINVNVLGVGTMAGAPYKNANGALHKVQGKVVTSKLNKTVLQAIAKEGRGIYAEVSINNAGIKAILRNAEQKDIDQQQFTGKIRQWDDRYYWFLLPAAMILLYLIRERALYLLVLAISLGCMLPTNSYAFSWGALFTNNEQKGQQAYVAAEFTKAAELFKDSYRKGVALYRDAQYAAAEEQFAASKRKEVSMAAIYNMGNAQMQQQKWRAAIKSYETVLDQEPENFAAQHNLEIAKKMLEQAKDEDDEQEQPPQQCKNPKPSADKMASNDPAKKPPQNKPEQQAKQDQDQNEDPEKSDQQNQKDKQDQSDQQDQKDNSDADQQQANAAQEESDQAKRDQASSGEPTEEQARAEQWLNRIDSDIKIFLKNKCYIEDVLSTN
jgi:Ca-activated chloride channel family protein